MRWDSVFWICFCVASLVLVRWFRGLGAGGGGEDEHVCGA